MFPFFDRHKDRLDYKAALNLIYDRSMPVLRGKVKILIADDEAFDIVDMLKERKYDIYYKKDITYAIEAEPFDIVIIDIHGIASALGSAMGGFAVAEEIKKYYPAKQVWCYSGNVINDAVASKINRINGYIAKDTDIDQWCEKLDQIIATYCSDDYQVEILKNQLKLCGISEQDISRVVNEYRANIEQKNFGSVIELLTSLVDNGKILIGLIKLIYSYVEHFTA